MSTYSQEHQQLLNRDRTPAADPSYVGFDSEQVPAADEEMTPKKARNLCGRTFAFTMFFMLLACGIVGIFLKYAVNGFYWAFGASLVQPILYRFAAPYACQWFYRKQKNNRNWATVLSSCVFWSCLLMGLSTAIGGYFIRELDAVNQGTSYLKLSVKDPPKQDVGQIVSFGGGARVYPEFGGRAIAWGVFPVCVAPILELSTDKTVNYWAIGNGPCCGKQPMTCDGWTDGVSRGATIMKYRELYPKGLVAAEQSRDPPLNMLPNPNAVFVSYGDVTALKSSMKYYGILTLCLGFGLTMLLVTYKTLSGPY